MADRTRKQRTTKGVNGMALKSIRETARELNIPENYLRTLHKNNDCPGVHSGVKFLVDVDALRDMLAERAAAAVKKPQAS